MAIIFAKYFFTSVVNLFILLYIHIANKSYISKEMFIFSEEDKKILLTPFKVYTVYFVIHSLSVSLVCVYIMLFSTISHGL